MDEEYKQSDISKEVERLMDEEGFTFGEAVKQAMAEGYKDGGLMIAIQRFAQGGGVGSLMQPRINFKGGGASHSKSSSKSKSSSNQGPAGGASAGGNYGGNKNPNQTYGGGGGGNNNNGGGGGNNNTTTKPNPGSGRVTKVKRVAKPSFFNKLNTHFLNNQKLKNAVKAGEITVDDYNVLGGYDAKQTLGLSPLATALTSGAYNLVQSALGPKFSGANQPLFDGALDIGKNTFGSTLDPDSAYATQYDEIMNTYKDGGGVGSLMQPKRQGLFMGGSPLSGEALAIYNSMNAYGYDDQTIADKLLALNLYTPPGTTPPDTTPPPPPPGGGNNGGDGGDGPAIITKKTTTKDPNTFNADTFDDATIIDKYVYDRPYNMRNVAGDDLAINFDITDLGNPTGDSRIVSEELGSTGFGKPNIRDVAGDISTGSNIMESLISGSDIPEARRAMTQPGLTDKATVYDPYGIKVEDGRFSYDMNKTSVDDFKKGLSITDRNRNQITSTPKGGITTIDKSNMRRDIAGPSTTVDESITMENIGVPDIPGVTDNFSNFGFGNFAEFGPQTIDDLSNIGMAKDPEGVEDPFGGKYTPSFEEKKVAEGILAGLIDDLKGYDFKDALTPKSITTGLIGSKLAGLLNVPTAIGSFGANQFRKKLEANKTEKAIAASKNRKETRALQAKIDAAEKKRQDDITKTDNANAKAAAAGKAYDYSGRSNKQGTHTSTVSKQKAADNRESARGQTTSSKGSSKSTSSSKGSTSSGAGGGGGASRGRSSGRNSSQRGGGFNSYGFSDIRLKDNIQLVGKSPSNINIYNFTYLKDSKVYQGVMAHEVPWASVKHDSGYLMVDYNKVDVDFKIVH